MHKTTQDITAMTNFYSIKQLLVLYDIWWTKCYFCILDKKIVLCLKISVFVQSIALLICPVTGAVLKSNTV